MSTSDEPPMSPTTGKPVPKSQTYEGGCHCGQVRFTVKLSPPLEDVSVTKCNCSICTANGHLMVYPLESQITWHSGKDSMTNYSFGEKKVAHSFCPVCGTSICGRSIKKGFFENNRALNVRTLKDIDLDQLKLRIVDGRSA